jgi:pantothenate synthetase
MEQPHMRVVSSLEKLAKYPRDLPSDLAMLEAAGADVVFTPSEEISYNRLAKHLLIHPSTGIAMVCSDF